MTDVEIATAALALVKKPGIAAFNENSASARACNALFASLRDKVLEDRIWSFAKEQYELDQPDATAPLFKWEYRFAFPADVLAVVSVENADGIGVAFDVQGRFIFTNEAVIHVTAKKRVTDPTLFTPNFTFALTVLLASYLAVPLAENAGLMETYSALYLKLVKDASGADGSAQSSSGNDGVSWVHRARM